MSNEAQSDYVIDVSDISKAFSGKKVVDGVSLQVKRGEIFGFLGPNGSGKTTTIRMICGLLTPDAGQGTCLGCDIFTQAGEIKQQVGYMTQRFSLYEDLTVEENLAFIARLYSMTDRKERVDQCIERLSIGQKRRKQLAGNLSGGWKQRLALAAAIIHEPKLLLLDEPTAGVDPKARRDFWDQIHHLADEGITSLVSTHYMDEAERCHRLGYLAYGDLLAYGEMQKVIDQAHIRTWEVTGNNLSELAEQLRHAENVAQVTPFGRTLHVSIKKEVGEDVLAPWQQSATVAWQEIAPSLEDAFIAYMATQEDNFQ